MVFLVVRRSPGFRGPHQQVDAFLMDFEDVASDGDDGGRADFAVSNVHAISVDLIERARVQRERVSRISIDLACASGQVDTLHSQIVCASLVDSGLVGLSIGHGVHRFTLPGAMPPLKCGFLLVM